MSYIDNILFVVVLAVGFGYFALNIKKLVRNIKLGHDVNRNDNPGERWTNMAMIALGQSKMVRRPVAGILHIIVYVGFVVINIELLEIIIDGIIGTHRLFSFMGGFYNFLIGFFEILAFGVIFAVTVFWIRRNIIKLKRFINKDLKGWPKNDANYILYFETVLMILFLTMNAADGHLQSVGAHHYIQAGSFPISGFISPIFNGMAEGTVIIIERTTWWLHIIGIMVFMNYLYFSKHLHILLAFPNTYFANLKPKGKFVNLESVTNEVKLMMDPNADPFAAAPAGAEGDIPAKFGASDVQDLNWVQLMNAYTCTECGRCTDSCPANHYR